MKRDCLKYKCLSWEWIHFSPDKFVLFSTATKKQDQTVIHPNQHCPMLLPNTETLWKSKLLAWGVSAQDRTGLAATGIARNVREKFAKAWEIQCGVSIPISNSQGSSVLNLFEASILLKEVQKNAWCNTKIPTPELTRGKLEPPATDADLFTVRVLSAPDRNVTYFGSGFLSFYVACQVTSLHL